MSDITRKGVTLNQALQEAAASSPIGRAMLYGYELWHETLAEPIRFVNNTEAMTATLEADAPRNAGEAVEFLAIPLAMERPEESDTAASPSVTLSRPDVSGILKAALDDARGSLASWTIIERLYASDDLSTPAMLPPLTYELTSAQIAGAAAKITAAFDDDANVAIPRITFKGDEYPGLLR
jgi:Domain of unknown function (DUF1833)